MKRWYDKRLQNKEFKKGDKVLLYNSRFKLFGKGKLQSKWDGPYVVHSVSPTGVVTIMDAKGDRYVVNGQRLKVFLEPDVVPLHYIDILLSVETHRRAATGNTKSREVAGALAGTAPSSTARNSVTRPENV
jgi:hypothetical protein